MKILLIQGANMAYLGKRGPEIYGTTAAAQLDRMLQRHARERGFELEIYYTHIEGEPIGRVLQAAESIAAREAGMAQALRAGRPITAVMGANYEHMLKE